MQKGKIFFLALSVTALHVEKSPLPASFSPHTLLSTPHRDTALPDQVSSRHPDKVSSQHLSATADHPPPVRQHHRPLNRTRPARSSAQANPRRSHGNRTAAHQGASSGRYYPACTIPHTTNSPNKVFCFNHSGACAGTQDLCTSHWRGLRVGHHRYALPSSLQHG